MEKLDFFIDEFWEEPPDYIAKFPAGTSGLVPVVVHGNGPSKDAGLSRETVIVAIDQKPVHGFGLMWTQIPNGAEDQTGDRPLAERARLLRHASLFVGREARRKDQARMPRKTVRLRVSSPPSLSVSSWP